MGGSFWNHCFLCASSEQLIERGRRSSGGRTADEEVKKTSIHNGVSVLLKYLLGIFCNNEETRVYKDVLELEEDHGFKLCRNCERTAGQVLELQLQLEVVQMKIVDKLKGVREEIIGYGRNPEVSRDFETLEKWLELGDELGRDCEEEKRFLDVLKRFQATVCEKDLRVPWRISYVRPQPDDNNGKGMTSGVRKTPGFRNKPVNGVRKQSERKMRKLNTENNSDEESIQQPAQGFKQESIVSDLDEHEQDVDMVSLPDTDSYIDNFSGFESEESLEATTDTTTLENSNSTTKEVAGGRSDEGSKESTGVITRHSKKVRKASEEKTTRLVRKKTAKSGSKHYVDPRVFKCQLCPFRTSGGTTHRACLVDSHLKKHEILTEKNHNCTHCNQGFTHEQTLKRHLKTHRIKTKCDVCNELIVYAKLEDHLKDAHPNNKIYYCEFCGFICGTYAALAQHAVLEPGESGRKCELCPPDSETVFIKRSILLRHLYEIHNCTEVAFKCEEPGCTEVFYDKVLRTRHKIKHRRRYVCQVCDKACTRPGDLKLHIRVVHEKKKDFQCDLCPERFYYKKALESHKDSKHGEKAYECELCPGQQYVNKNDLIVHNHKFHRDLSYKCRICGKTFAYKSLLKLHEEVHSEGKNFTCEICGAALKSRRWFRSHMNRHHKVEENFACTFCPKAFNASQGLKLHLKTHNQVKLYQCDICGLGLTQLRQLKTHKEKKHPELSQDAAKEKSRDERDWNLVVSH